MCLSVLTAYRGGTVLLLEYFWDGLTWAGEGQRGGHISIVLGVIGSSS